MDVIVECDLKNNSQGKNQSIWRETLPVCLAGTVLGFCWVETGI